MEPIQKKSTVDLAVEKLTEYICSGGIAVGDKMPAEMVLCKQLNISRTTIREAYRVLQSQGYLDIQPGRGAFVQSKEQNFIQEAMDWISSHRVVSSDYLFVRMALDPLAASLAAENAVSRDIDELCTIHQAFVKSVHEKDYVAMAELDARFHARIAAITHNDLLIALVGLVNHYFEILRQNSFQFERNASHAIVPHERILEAIAAGDSEQAKKESVAHMQAAIQDLCRDDPTVR